MSWNIQLLPLISTRVCLYRAKNRERIIVRHSREGKRFLLPGGKLNSHSLETLEAGAKREVQQETLFHVDSLELIALLPCSRIVHVDSNEARELGIAKRKVPAKGLPGLITLEVVFAAAVTGELPTKLVEGRRVSEIRLDEKSIRSFKERHQRAAELCLEYLSSGKTELRSAERKLLGNFQRLVLARAA